MKKYYISLFLFIFSTACYRLPQRAEVEYRNNLENAIIETFPKKVTILIHPFDNLSPSDTNRSYLSEAIPDSVEAMLEPMRATLAYMPFDGMPFYVSEKISNLFQTVDTDNTNDEDEEEDEDDKDDDEKDKDRNTDAYFSYLTNYLLKVPTQVTQVDYELTTNTNYYQIFTNTEFKNGESVTNLTSNEILLTKTNKTITNVIIKNKNILTTTNMLLLIHEEFPDLEDYLSYLPIEIRRATKEENADYERITNPTKWKARKLKEKKEAQKQAQEKERERKKKQEELKKKIEQGISTNQIELPKEEKEETNSFYPEKSFDYIYHISGNYRTRNRTALEPIEVLIKLQISLPESSGLEWWEDKYHSRPIKLSKILALEKRLDPKNPQEFTDLYLRTPYKKPKRSARLQDEFDMVSTNFREEKPPLPKKGITPRTRPVYLSARIREDQIPYTLLDWLKYFHATIINRPYTPLRVNTTPEDTLIYLNGFYIGKTPLVYPTAPIGMQRITFIKEGFSREEILVDILPNQTNSIGFDLKTLDTSGIIAITASIPNAEVYINAQYKGIAPLVISNLNLDTKYRIEVLNPNANLTSNRNSVYKTFTLDQNKKNITFDAKFKTFETAYRTPAQKALLAGTYISWLSTIAILGVSVYTQARAKELEALAVADPKMSATLKRTYRTQSANFFIASQATLYTAIAGVIISSGIMGWYIYSKEIYLGLDLEQKPQEWYANFKLKF